MYFIELESQAGERTLTSTENRLSPRLRAHASRYFPDARFWIVSGQPTNQRPSVHPLLHLLSGYNYAHACPLPLAKDLARMRFSPLSVRVAWGRCIGPAIRGSTGPWRSRSCPTIFLPILI